MLKSTNSRTFIMIMLILISVPLLGYLHEAKAYTGVGIAGSRLGTVTCPNGEQHEGAIAFDATTTPAMGGDYDINLSTPNGEVLKSGKFNYVNIQSSGEFKLTGKEVRDDVCGTLASVGSTYITVTGICVPGGEVSTIKFTWADGQTTDFPGDPTCR